ncbi:MAG TPA: hypothetical protein PKD10_05575 [Paracoccaceae bacterium]|mgnify:CR=1 FL=1|nr:hypothetical protein [Paracoccaceae bacterium]
MATIDIHPSEIAYGFSYARVSDVVGWGIGPFLPPTPEDGPLDAWLIGGEDRLIAAGRLTGAREAGLHLDASLTAAILALAAPEVVLLAQRKAGKGMRKMTVHCAGDDFIGLMLRGDGMFEMTRYADLVAASGACAGFVGAGIDPQESEARVETDAAGMARVMERARSGDTGGTALMLGRMGLGAVDAQSAAQALVAPAASGVVSAMYCRMNAVVDVETYSVLTDGEDRTWVIFAPAGAEGPTILELSSASGLTARVAVGVVARSVPAG